ncbi:unnamed protein product [Amoebophrya sp. A25]|nr:unnamed protein product [Amoebophrya sp. A25]|eukprot:GSA25T00019443001.1
MVARYGTATFSNRTPSKKKNRDNIGEKLSCSPGDRQQGGQGEELEPSSREKQNERCDQREKYRAEDDDCKSAGPAAAGSISTPVAAVEQAEESKPVALHVNSMNISSPPKKKRRRRKSSLVPLPEHGEFLREREDFVPYDEEQKDSKNHIISSENKADHTSEPHDTRTKNNTKMNDIDEDNSTRNFPPQQEAEEEAQGPYLRDGTEKRTSNELDDYKDVNLVTSFSEVSSVGSSDGEEDSFGSNVEHHIIATPYFTSNAQSLTVAELQGVSANEQTSSEQQKDGQEFGTRTSSESRVFGQDPQMKEAVSSSSGNSTVGTTTRGAPGDAQHDDQGGRASGSRFAVHSTSTTEKMNATQVARGGKKLDLGDGGEEDLLSEKGTGKEGDPHEPAAERFNSVVEVVQSSVVEEKSSFSDITHKNLAHDASSPSTVTVEEQQKNEEPPAVDLASSVQDGVSRLLVLAELEETRRKTQKLQSQCELLHMENARLLRQQGGAPPSVSPLAISSAQLQQLKRTSPTFSSARTPAEQGPVAPLGSLLHSRNLMASAPSSKGTVVSHTPSFRDMPKADPRLGLEASPLAMTSHFPMASATRPQISTHSTRHREKYERMRAEGYFLKLILVKAGDVVVDAATEVLLAEDDGDCTGGADARQLLVGRTRREDEDICARGGCSTQERKKSPLELQGGEEVWNKIDAVGGSDKITTVKVMNKTPSSSTCSISSNSRSNKREPHYSYTGAPTGRETAGAGATPSSSTTTTRTRTRRQSSTSFERAALLADDFVAFLRHLRRRTKPSAKCKQLETGVINFLELDQKDSTKRNAAALSIRVWLRATFASLTCTREALEFVRERGILHLLAEAARLSMRQTLSLYFSLWRNLVLTPARVAWRLSWSFVPLRLLGGWAPSTPTSSHLNYDKKSMVMGSVVVDEQHQGIAEPVDPVQLQGGGEAELLHEEEHEVQEEEHEVQELQVVQVVGDHREQDGDAHFLHQHATSIEEVEKLGEQGQQSVRIQRGDVNEVRSVVQVVLDQVEPLVSDGKAAGRGGGLSSSVKQADVSDDKVQLLFPSSDDGVDSCSAELVPPCTDTRGSQYGSVVHEHRLGVDAFLLPSSSNSEAEGAFEAPHPQAVSSNTTTARPGPGPLSLKSETKKVGILDLPRLGFDAAMFVPRLYVRGVGYVGDTTARAVKSLVVKNNASSSS